MPKKKISDIAKKIAKGLIENKLLPIRKGGFDVLGNEDSVGGNAILRKSSNVSNEERDFQTACDNGLIISKALNQPLLKTAYWNEFKNGQLYNKFVKAVMNTETAGFGTEWAPAEFSSELIRIMDLELRVAALHRDIPMGKKSLTLNRVSSTGGATLIAEGVAPTAAGVGTANFTLTPVKLMSFYQSTQEMDEDSIVPIVNEIRFSITRDLGRSTEDATINGDTTATHQDSDVTAGTDARKAWKGYRKLHLSAAEVAGGGTAVTFQMLKDTKKKMGKYGVSGADLAWIVSSSGLSQIGDLTQFQTLDTFGPQATVVAGQQGAILGSPVIPSEFVRENLNASGVYDGVTTTRTIILLVKKSAFIYGTRRQIQVETDRNITTQNDQWVGSFRKDFKPVYDDTTETIVAEIVNLLA